MAKPPKKPKDEDIEVAPDAWERFERAIDTVTRKPKAPSSNKGKKTHDRKGESNHS